MEISYSKVKGDLGHHMKQLFPVTEPQHKHEFVYPHYTHRKLRALTISRLSGQIGAKTLVTLLLVK